MEVRLEIGRLQQVNDNVKREFKWARSHQDKKELTAGEKLNDRSDHLASKCRNNAAQGLLNIEPNQSYDGSLATLKVNDTVINNN